MENSTEVHVTTTSRSLNQLGVRNPPAACNDMKFDREKSVNIICEKAVRYSFVSHLSAALSREGISVSVNDEDVQNQTVNDWATVSVVVISDLGKPWFVKLTKVTERMDNNGHLVVSVIYGVDPLNRGLLIEFLEDRNLIAHRSRSSTNTKNSDSELVTEIVGEVYEKLFPTERIGIYWKLLEIEDLLCKQPWGILRSIGLWGIPGIGKTTLAKAVFDRMSNDDYDASCFIENFDEAFHKEGLHRLVDENIGKVLKEKFGIDSSYIMRPSLLKTKLCDKTILLVLDDVRDPLAAESFLGRLECFGPGSLIIMTSRDKNVFPFCQISQIYEVQGLKEHEALQLFSQSAFGKKVPEDNHMEMSMKVVDYANGNPLALQIFGQELKAKMSEMDDAFVNLKQYPPQKIQDGLRNNVLQMSNLIKDIGKDILNGETERCTRMWDPSNIKYLLEDDKVKASGEPKETLKSVVVVEDIDSMSLDTSNFKFDVKNDVFKNMFNLRYLKIYNSSTKDVPGLNFPNGLGSLPCQLRLLYWENYPLQALPKDIYLGHLVELSMPYSQLQELTALTTKHLKMLKRIRLCHSQQIVKFDHFLYAQNVELIDLQGCTRLGSFPDTSELQHLRVVNLSGCTEIKSFRGAPPNIEELHLQGTSISEIPISMVTHSSQVKLDRKKLLSILDEFEDDDLVDLESVTNLVKVRSYNNHQGFGKLVHLNMKDCSKLRCLPDMVNLESLQVLLLSGCTRLEEIMGFPRNMRKLYIGGTAVKEVPQLPQTLEFLNAHGCKYLKSIHLDFEQLPRHYIFSNCYNLSSQVISEFLEKGLTRVADLVRAKQQELNVAPEASICIPIDARQRPLFRLQASPNAKIDLSPWTQKSLSGFAMSVVVSFKDDYHNALGFGIRCVCRWKKTGNNDQPDRTLIERFYQCWAPLEAPKVEWDHIFVFYDSKMLPTAIEENHSDMPAAEVTFEFHTVSWGNKLLGDTCRVTECGVQVIKPPTDGITTESEAISIVEDHPPPRASSSKELEAKTRSLSSSEPHKFSTVTRNGRSTNTMLRKLNFVEKSQLVDSLDKLRVSAGTSSSNFKKKPVIIIVVGMAAGN
ncbi:hypothetical protein Bca52824_036729 [Brassica carinata]|uniref:NB-ARC domain-containing protein n=1 Tax=Brassica carinata TaxID=52824 RepID=A0A8X7V306_BRACI|nr:hypothetical protein Bca52824_036729 [Brassica carinata]